MTTWQVTITRQNAADITLEYDTDAEEISGGPFDRQALLSLTTLLERIEALPPTKIEAKTP